MVAAPGGGVGVWVSGDAGAPVGALVGGDGPGLPPPPGAFVGAPVGALVGGDGPGLPPPPGAFVGAPVGAFDGGEGPGVPGGGAGVGAPVGGGPPPPPARLASCDPPTARHRARNRGTRITPVKTT